MKTLRSYVGGRFIDGTGAPVLLVNPATEEPVAELRPGGLDAGATLAYAREKGGPALRELTFADRGELLKKLAKLVHAHRDELLALGIANGGNTRSDAKFDVDGASGTLAAYGELGTSLGATRLLVEGEPLQLGRSVRFCGQHVSVAREGVAVHINAFNFPAWGLAEKAAVALLAGVPIVTKPATSTALLAHRLVEIFLESQLLPEGALSFIAGPIGDLTSHLGGQDVLAFTGSGDTGASLRGLEKLVRSSVRINVEADSLNAAVLGPDVEPGSECWHLFIADVVRDMIQKSGQKCTAIRRVLIPAAREEAVREALCEKLAEVKVGNPASEEVGMGPLATAQQLRDVRAGIARLAGESESVFGGQGDVRPLATPAGKGFFVGPVLLRARDAEGAIEIHRHEVFGPVATLLVYDGSARRAAAIVRQGGGGLVSSIYSDDRAFLAELFLAIAPYQGRVLLANSKLAGHAVPPGTVLPQLIHGGPGRAGGGEELGGLRGLGFYMQRTAIQGDRPILEQLFGGKAKAESA